jgi:hypothetical protein
MKWSHLACKRETGLKRGQGTPLKEAVQSTLTEMLQSAWARENSIKESKRKKLP